MMSGLKAQTWGIPNPADQTAHPYGAALLDALEFTARGNILPYANLPLLISRKYNNQMNTFQVITIPSSSNHARTNLLCRLEDLCIYSLFERLR